MDEVEPVGDAGDTVSEDDAGQTPAMPAAVLWGELRSRPKVLGLVGVTLALVVIGAVSWDRPSPAVELSPEAQEQLDEAAGLVECQLEVWSWLSTIVDEMGVRSTATWERMAFEFGANSVKYQRMDAAARQLSRLVWRVPRAEVDEHITQLGRSMCDAET